MQGRGICGFRREIENPFDKTTTYSVCRTFYCFVVLSKETKLLATDSDNRVVSHSMQPFNGIASVKCGGPLSHVILGNYGYMSTTNRFKH